MFYTSNVVSTYSHSVFTRKNDFADSSLCYTFWHGRLQSKRRNRILYMQISSVDHETGKHKLFFLCRPSPRRGFLIPEPTLRPDEMYRDHYILISWDGKTDGFCDCIVSLILTSIDYRRNYIYRRREFFVNDFGYTSTRRHCTTILLMYKLQLERWQ